MKNERISIIVPVYKVEAYLEKCVRSLLAQTHTELEILLVDDGSPDGCPALCDAFAQEEARVRAIHKKNGGVSSARNAGLRAATGDYIGFVDSDDAVAPGMFAALWGLMRSGADMACCGYRNILPDGPVEVLNGNAERLLDRQAAMGELVRNDTFRNYLWNKLYKRSLFDGLYFREGSIMEDLDMLYRLIDRCALVACTPAPLYDYLARPGSAVATLGAREAANWYTIVQTRREALAQDYPALAPALFASVAAVALEAVCSIRSRADRAQYPQHALAAAFLRENRTALEDGAGGFDPMQMRKLRLFYASPALLRAAIGAHRTLGKGGGQ